MPSMPAAISCVCDAEDAIGTLGRAGEMTPATGEPFVEATLGVMMMCDGVDRSLGDVLLVGR